MYSLNLLSNHTEQIQNILFCFPSFSYPNMKQSLAHCYLVELQHVKEFKELAILLVVLQFDVVLAQAVQSQLRLVVNVHFHGLHHRVERDRGRGRGGNVRWRKRQLEREREGGGNIDLERSMLRNPNG